MCEYSCYKNEVACRRKGFAASTPSQVLGVSAVHCIYNSLWAYLLTLCEKAVACYDYERETDIMYEQFRNIFSMIE